MRRRAEGEKNEDKATQAKIRMFNAIWCKNAMHPFLFELRRLIVIICVMHVKKNGWRKKKRNEHWPDYYKIIMNIHLRNINIRIIKMQ